MNGGVKVGSLDDSRVHIKGWRRMEKDGIHDCVSFPVLKAQGQVKYSRLWWSERPDSSSTGSNGTSGSPSSALSVWMTWG